MDFDFYYGSQADQFSFIKIPRAMITDKVFASLSLQAKMLYSILLDRMTLSRKNSWFDEKNRVFIIYPITEIQSDLGFSKKKAMDYLTELEQFGLVVKKKRGFGLPSIIYVKSFLIQQSVRGIETGTTGNFRSTDFGTSGDIELSSRSVEMGTSEVQKTTLQEVPETAALISKTEKNKTDMNNTASNQILSREIDWMGSDENAKETINAYENLIKENIGYESLLVVRPHDQRLIEGIVQLILEIVLAENETILIASTTYPAALVKTKFMKLTYWHVMYVIDCLNANTTKVKNIKKYLLAALFNAPSTIDGYYKAEVNHDMPQFAG